ncbi:MAG: hypothetical protein R3F20_07860 [Planctomycetota bacterium]
MSEKLEGSVLEPGCDTSRRDALAKAVDYRGDVTLGLADGREITGFVFHASFEAAEPFLEYFPPDEGAAKERLLCADVKRVAFSGRDTADGKSWEAWVARQAEKKAQGAD